MASSFNVTTLREKKYFPGMLNTSFTFDSKRSFNENGVRSLITIGKTKIVRNGFKLGQLEAFEIAR